MQWAKPKPEVSYFGRGALFRKKWPEEAERQQAAFEAITWCEQTCEKAHAQLKVSPKRILSEEVECAAITPPSPQVALAILAALVLAGFVAGYYVGSNHAI